MRRSTIAVIVLLACAGRNVRAQHERDNVEGWGKATWGMTTSQILKAVPGAKRLAQAERYTEGSYAEAGITMMALDGEPFAVRFLMGSESGRLERVNFKYLGKSGYRAFHSVRDILTEHYGQPRTKDDDCYWVMWLLPKTRISLGLFVMESEGVQDLTITFSSRAAHNAENF